MNLSTISGSTIIIIIAIVLIILLLYAQRPQSYQSYRCPSCPHPVKYSSISISPSVPLHEKMETPILNGILVKHSDDQDPTRESTKESTKESTEAPNMLPLFRFRSQYNPNRYFYYVVDQKYPGKMELKIPLDHVRVNGIRYTNADYYGLPELYDDDMIDGISVYPNDRYRVLIYKPYFS